MSSIENLKLRRPKNGCLKLSIKEICFHLPILPTIGDIKTSHYYQH